MNTIPDRYHGVPGHLKMVEAEYLYNVPFRLGGGNYGNIGTLSGRSAVMLAGGLIESGVKGEITAVDIQPHNAVWQFEKKGVDHVIEFFTEGSEEVSTFFEDGSFRFVFIDGDHSYKGVSTDFAVWNPKVAPDGEVAFHDSETEYVGRFLEELKAAGEWEEVGKVHTLSWWKRVS